MPKTPPASPNRSAPAGDSPRRSPPGGGGGPAPWAAAAALILLGFLALAPVLRGGWLWDDNTEVTGNRILFDRAGLARIWRAPTGPDYFPLKSTWQWIEWRLWGAQPAGYHAASLGLHLASALLVWRLFRRLGIRWAWLGGLLFAVHPLAVESVAWAAELKNTLSLPLLLLAMIFYLKYDDLRAAKPSKRWTALPPMRLLDSVLGQAHWGQCAPPYLLSLFFFLLALLAKTSVVMLPAVLLLHAWWKRGRIAGRDLSATAPFFALSLALGLVTLRFQQHLAIGGWKIDAGPPWLRLGRAGVAIGFYLWKSLLPVRLSPLYPPWSLPLLSPAVILTWLGLIVLVAWGWIQRKSWGRHVLFGLGFFALNLLPAIGLVAMSYMHYSWVADRFAYISIIGVAGLAAAGAGALARSAPPWPTVTAGATAAVVGWLALASHLYTRVFHDSETLWTYVLGENPASWAAHYNLGFALVGTGRVPEGIAQYREALRLKPDFPEAQNDFGRVLFLSGQRQEAIEHLREALRLEPGYAEAHSNLGNALLDTGRVSESIKEYAEALRLRPNFPDAEINLANALIQAGRGPEAFPHFQEALRLQPDFSKGRYAWGVALAGAGRWPDAAEQFARAAQEAAENDPLRAAAENYLGVALLHENRPAEALPHLEAALRLAPGETGIRQTLDYARQQAEK